MKGARSLASRVYVAAQRLLPARFRSEHGASMRCVFEERLDAELERGGSWAFWWLVRDMADVAATGMRLRLAAARSRGRGRAEERRRSMPMRDFARDVRHGVRLWSRTPGFTALAVSTLAAGIGCTAAIFTVVDAVLLRPLPHPHGDRLVMVWHTLESQGGSRIPMSYPNLLDLRAAGAGATGLESVGAYQGSRMVTVDLGTAPEALRSAPVDGSLFGVLGNEAAIGRAIGAEDDRPGAPPVVVLSHGLWQTRFGGERNVIGRAIRIEGLAHEVIGVMRAGFSFPGSAVDLWVPLRLDPAETSRDLFFLGAIGRLAPGVTLADARRRLGAFMARLAELYPAETAGRGIDVDLRKRYLVGDARPAMLVLLGAVVLLLLLSCANVANLMLARATTRRRELALRIALGARRGRLARQMLAEGLVLAAAGGLLGVLAARVGVGVLAALAPPNLPRRHEIALDARVLGFAVGVTVLTGLLFAAAPALRAAAAGVDATLRDGVRGIATGGRHRLLRGLVIAQLAIAVVLLVGGGLLLNSFVRLRSVDPGYDAARALTIRIAPPTARYPGFTQHDAFYDALLERARAMPGVQAAGGTWALPFDGDYASGRVTVEGRPLPREDAPVVGMIPVRGDYFDAMGIEFVAGRDYSAAERSTEPSAIVINAAAARRLFPEGDALGRRLKMGDADEGGHWLTVVGVVADSKRAGLAAEPEPELYPVHEASTWARMMTVVVRVRDGVQPAALAAGMRSILHDLDPEIAPMRVAAAADLIAESVAEPRFRSVLVAAFAVAALVLAIVGTYGVLAFVVAGRTHEIGVRMAVGADRHRVVREVMTHGGTWIAIGLAIGLAAAALTARTLESMLFGVGARDPATYCAVVAVIAVTALLACWLPARRASRVEPVAALRV